MSNGDATANLLVNVFDGTRNPIASDISLLITITDGNQKLLESRDFKGPAIPFKVPFYNNFGDNYTVVVSAKRFEQAGFHPVKVSNIKDTSIDVLLLPKKGSFRFLYQDWPSLKKNDAALATLLGQGAANQTEAANRYNDLVDGKPKSLAALFNITTAMSQIHLPVGTPLDCLKQVIWDDTLAQDRFYAWADVKLIDLVKQAAAEGEFAPEHGSAIFHKGATLSYKQIQFGEANVQLTFHEGDTQTIDGVDCVKVEPDIDYYKDPLAHALLEVLPNTISGGLTNPRPVYVLRWIAGRHAGVPEFNPPYTIE